MIINVKQISSLEKIRRTDSLPEAELLHKTVLAGERFSYQICIKPEFIQDMGFLTKVSVDSPLKDHIRIYQVKDAMMDTPVTIENPEPEDYISLTPGLMPDILIPLEEQNHTVTVANVPRTLWIRVDIPKDSISGHIPVTIRLEVVSDKQTDPSVILEKTMDLEILSEQMPEQKLIYTRWFYADCIATQHNVEIYSEAHWALIDKYIAAAADLGINMILVPVHTPPLDTAIGTRRPCVQLVDIEKNGDTYRFSFARFTRFIDICKKNGIRYFEIAHMFSQWGAKCAPNIMVTENGKTDYLFGWDVAASSPAYVNFLKQYIAAISAQLEIEGISENTYFHISDEPNPNTLDTYQTASDLIRPLIGSSKTFDALSNFTFYEKGLVECPVTSVTHVHEFLEHPIPNQWTYYCCNPQQIYTNGFMAMPSARTRVLGFLLYKYDIKGFLHWGYNFYNSCISWYPLNPYLSTSGDGAYPSGDPFLVYPARDGVYHSIRGQVFHDGIQDMNVCLALEKYIGRQAVVELIDRTAGMDLRFDSYPSGAAFLETLRAAITEQLKKYTL